MSDPLRLVPKGERDLLRTWEGGTFVPPTLATLTDKRFSEPSWLYERKLDGVRIVAGAEGGKARLWSRNEKRVDTAYPEIAEVLAARNVDQFVADGEVVAFEGNQTSFAKLQNRIHLSDPQEARQTGITVYFYLFDLMSFDGMDLTQLPLRTRKRLLRECFTFHAPLRFSQHRVGDGEDFHRQACAWGWEGLIAKNGERPYREGRTRDWLKFKCVADQEFVIGGFTDPQGQRQGFGALLVGYYDGQRLRYAGKVGTGYDERTLHDLRTRLDDLTQGTSPFADPVPDRGAHWVSPELVAEIGFTEWTNDNKLRHPRYTGLRQDKPATRVIKER